MSDELERWILGLITLGIVGLVKYVHGLGQKIEAHKLHVAEEYMRKGMIAPLQQDMQKLKDRIEDLLKAVYKIEARMEAKEHEQK